MGSPGGHTGSRPLQLAVLHGPNLNLLGRREPTVYGTGTLSDITESLDALAATLGARLSHFQSNHEGLLIDRIHAQIGVADGIVINPAGLGHTSVSLRDALTGAAVPFVEVHLSNIHSRESFRHRSLLSDVAVGTIAGFGSLSYSLALRGLVGHLRGRPLNRPEP